MNRCLKLSLAILSTLLGASVLAAPGDGSTAMLASSSTPAAKEVYKYIASRVKQSSKQLIWGQHLGGINDINIPGVDPLPQNDMDPRHKSFNIDNFTVGTKYPSIISARYEALDMKSTNNGNCCRTGSYTLNSDYITAINNNLIDAWKTHQSIPHIVAVPRNPWNTEKGRTPDDSSTQKISSLLIMNGKYPKSPEGIQFWADVEVIAAGLGQLRDAGVPVIFRPLPEYNINKYYGVGQISGDFVKLWQQVHDTYVNKYELNNLIFCWEVWVLNRNQSSQLQSVIGPWFPGSAYVDIVSGAYYFSPANSYDYFKDRAFSPEDSPSAQDSTVHYALVNLAYTNNRPFASTQWGVNWLSSGDDADDGGCQALGNNLDTLDFSRTVLVGNNSSPTIANERRMAFVNYWDKDCATVKQYNADTFVGLDDGDTTVVTSEEMIAVRAVPPVDTDDGWFTGRITQTGVTNELRTGDDNGNSMYQSIAAFDTGLLPNPPLPPGVTLTSAALRFKKAKNSYGDDPIALPAYFGVLTLDAPTSGFCFGNCNVLLSSEDYLNPPFPSGLTTVSHTPAMYNAWAEFAVPSNKLSTINPTGESQFRLRFSKTTNGDNGYNFNYWISADPAYPIADRPEMILTYIPN